MSRPFVVKVPFVIKVLAAVLPVPPHVFSDY